MNWKKQDRKKRTPQEMLCFIFFSKSPNLYGIV